MKKISYGGQAVIEGVMMSGPEGKAIAVRTEDGELVYKIDDKPSFLKRHPALNKPFIRGIFAFGSSMKSGIGDLTWSAEQAGETEDEKLSAASMIGAVILAIILAVGIFIALPVFAATWLHPFVGDFGRSLIEGVLRVGIFLIYIIAISKMEDIRRLFAYHGAEHKTINAYEAGAELTPENVSQYTRIHTRCGTSFIMMAMVLMILVFTFVGQTGAVLRILIKLALLPVVAGVAYELFRLPLRFPNNKFVRALVAPGLALQRLTTKEPDPDQLEVAIAALTSVPGFGKEDEEEAEAEEEKEQNEEKEATDLTEQENIK